MEQSKALMYPTNCSTVIRAKELQLSQEANIKSVPAAILKATQFQTSAQEISARIALGLEL